MNVSRCAKGKRTLRARARTDVCVSVGRRSLTPHCLGGARSLSALCPMNVCRESGGTVELNPWSVAFV